MKRKDKNDSLKLSEKNILNLVNDKNIKSSLNISEFGQYDNREERINKFGTNEKNVRKFNYFKEFFSSFLEPFNILLMIIGTVELFLYIFYKPDGKRDSLELVSAIVVYAMVLLAAITDFIQECLSYRNTSKLLALIENEVFVIKNKLPNQIEANWINSNIVKMKDIDLTKGDVIFLNQGDIVPADIKILWSDNLYVDQSTLTGESDPIEKSVEGNKSKNIFQQNNLLISQTTIISGKCVGLVLTVGKETYANQILEIATENNDETDYEIGLAKVTKMILLSILAFFPILLVISGLRTDDWVRATIFAISMVVSLTPESLPAIISSNIQVGSKRMAANDIVVKNFKCVQNLGSTTIIATDKTGTLTTGDLTLKKGYDSEGKESKQIIDYAYLNSYYQTNLSNQIDEAILKGAKVELNNFKLLSEKDFDFKTRLASVLLQANNKNLQITKGAPEEILKVSNYILKDNKKTKLTKKDLDNINNQIALVEQKGLKSLLIAIKEDNLKIEENDLTYVGMITFENEIKNGVKEVIEIFCKYNLDLKVLTGDSPLVSEKVGKEINLPNTNTLVASEYEKMTDTEKEKAVEAYGIFSKLNPIEKSDVIELLRSNKEVITYLGDGINDVPALKSADVGISVNNGSSIAKATSDVILLKKDLRILESGIIDGRKIFTNAIKFIKIIVATNFGLLMTLLISTIWFKFAAMSPIQLLIQNLIYDFMNLAFVFDNVDENYIKKPKKWNPKSIITFALYNGIVPIIISITNFLIIGFGFDLFNQINHSSTQEMKDHYIQMFQSAFFLESLLTHIVLIFIYRTNEIALFKSRPSLTLTGFLMFFLSLGFMFEYIPGLNSTFGFVPMENNYWLLVLFGFIPVIWGLGELSKYTYIRLFNNWI